MTRKIDPKEAALILIVMIIYIVSAVYSFNIANKDSSIHVPDPNLYKSPLQIEQEQGDR